MNKPMFDEFGTEESKSLHVEQRDIVRSRKEAIEKASEFGDEMERQFKTDTTGIKTMSAVKRLIFNDLQSADLRTDGSNKMKNYVSVQNAVRYIVEEVMQLTPQQYDVIYSTELNSKAHIDHAIRKLVQGAPSEIRREALFDQKRILFRLCWPEYYMERYPKEKAMKIFDASGHTRGSLIRAARIKDTLEEDEPAEVRVLNNGKFSSAKKERKRVYNYGADVDKVIWDAMDDVFKRIAVSTTELFNILANPKKYGWNKFGCMQVIEARECYPSPLDFWFLNAPVAYQIEHVDEYMAIRNDANLPRIEMLDLLYDAYKETREAKTPDLEKGDDTE